MCMYMQFWMECVAEAGRAECYHRALLQIPRASDTDRDDIEKALYGIQGLQLFHLMYILWYRL